MNIDSNAQADAHHRFQQEAAALGASEALANIAVLLVGEDAGASLIGSAMKVWARQFGDEHGLEMARVALATVIDAQAAPTDVH